MDGLHAGANLTMIDCETFLANYSSFRDGDVSWEEREAFEEHLDECASCARYHRVVSDGAQVFRGLPELEVSESFQARLEARLYEVDLERVIEKRRASAATATATLSVAAVIAAAAWVPVMSMGAAGVGTLPMVSAQAARPSVPLADGENRPSLSAQLAALGVWHPPYSDLFRDSPLATPVGTLGAYDGGLALSLDTQ